MLVDRSGFGFHINFDRSSFADAISELGCKPTGNINGKKKKTFSRTTERPYQLGRLCLPEKLLSLRCQGQLSRLSIKISRFV